MYPKLQRMFRTSILRAYRNEPQTFDYEHIGHCLENLRQDTICDADDLPRHTEPEPSVRSAEGQTRQCRDFGALQAWAQDRTACYKFTHYNDPTWSRTDRLQYCPHDSPYLPRIREHFGYADDWIPDLDVDEYF
ncbi:hypothetical protein P7C71_g5720, partial [Lecanoromycetidae sp. Uapishka_2]